MKLSLEVKVVFVEDLKLCFTETSPKHENSITTKKCLDSWCILVVDRIGNSWYFIYFFILFFGYHMGIGFFECFF